MVILLLLLPTLFDINQISAVINTADRCSRISSGMVLIECHDKSAILSSRIYTSDIIKAQIRRG